MGKRLGTERAATELEKFLHEIGTELKVLVPYSDPSCLRIKNHYDVFPYETIVYDNGHFYKYSCSDIDDKAFKERYLIGGRDISPKYVIRLKGRSLYVHYSKKGNFYRLDTLQCNENNLVWFLTRLDAYEFIFERLLFLEPGQLEVIQIAGDKQ